MSLIEQIKVISFTFIFGIIFSFLYNIFYKYLYYKKKYIRIFINYFFFLIISSIYYYFVYQLNGGVIHIYMLLVFIISFLLYNKLFKKIRLVDMVK